MRATLLHCKRENRVLQSFACRAVHFCLVSNMTKRCLSLEPHVSALNSAVGGGKRDMYGTMARSSAACGSAATSSCVPTDARSAATSHQHSPAGR